MPAGTTIGVAYTAVEYAWEAHAYRYPRIDRERLSYVDFLEEPEVLVVSSYDLEPIREALQSELMLPGFEWPEAKDDVWYRGAEPTPEIFQFYDRLLNGPSDYCPVAVFTPNVLVPIEFPPPEIRVFARGGAAGGLDCLGGQEWAAQSETSTAGKAASCQLEGRARKMRLGDGSEG